MFLVGDPRYYARFGFRPVAELGIHNASSIPDDVVLGTFAYTNTVNGVAVPLPPGGSYSRSELVTPPITFLGLYNRSSGVD